MIDDKIFVSDVLNKLVQQYKHQIPHKDSGQCRILAMEDEKISAWMINKYLIQLSPHNKMDTIEWCQCDTPKILEYYLEARFAGHQVELLLDGELGAQIEWTGKDIICVVRLLEARLCLTPALFIPNSSDVKYNQLMLAAARKISCCEAAKQAMVSQVFKTKHEYLQQKLMAISNSQMVSSHQTFITCSSSVAPTAQSQKTPSSSTIGIYPSTKPFQSF